MKKVLILLGKNDWNVKEPFKDKQYQDSYELFYSLCRENGIEMSRASYEWYDYEKNIFKNAWTFSEFDGWKKVHDIKPDLI
ncbi:MAG: hypothetical protein WCW04_03670, partial [Candidatus Paceibacterota bacterium]